MADTQPLHVVTGAFGLTGRCIAKRLLVSGVRVRTLTRRPPDDSDFGRMIECRPFDFGNPSLLTDHLRGTEVLYNTYWVRFPHGSNTHERAVENTKTLIRCARDAGVRRMVHVSITNPDEASPLSYFCSKAIMERALFESGLSYAIVRPTALFGHGEILINNIAWMLRRLPLFGIFGDGKYRMQPVHLEDLADLIVKQGIERENIILDAVGPEIFTYEELVLRIREAVGGKARLIHVSPRTGLAIGKLLGWWLGDVLITREEIIGLMSNLLVSTKPPTCPTRIGDWLTANASQLGQVYASELARHY